MAVKRSAAETFTSEWDRAAAWAQSQGISASTYLPVYQYDVNRLQTYGYGMSAAERNRAILAAQNPNDVTPAPTDNPNPSNVFGNARHDVASIATGLINAPEGLWHLVDNTFHAATNPAKMDARTFGGTAANWLNDTVLALIPGAADLGTYLGAGGGNAGANALFEHPVVSTLDVIPAAKLLTGGLARAAAVSEVGARLAEHLDMTPEQIGQASLPRLVTKGIGGYTPTGRLARFGVTADKGMPRQLTLGEIVNSWAQAHTWSDVTSATRSLQAALLDTSQMEWDQYQWVYAPFQDALKNLSDPERAKMEQIIDNFKMKKGDVIGQAIDDKATTPALKEALEQWQRVMGYEAEDKLSRVGDDGRPAVVSLPTTDGKTGLYESSPASGPEKAWNAAQKAREGFLGQLEPVDRLVKASAANRAQVDAWAQKMTTALGAAQKRMAEDDRLDEVISRPKADRKRFGEQTETLLRRPQAERLLGRGGEVENLMQMAKDGRLDQIAVLAPKIRASMSRWDARAMKASIDPAYVGVRDLVNQVADLATKGRRLVKEIDNRILESESEAKFHVEHLESMQGDFRGASDLSKRARMRERTQLSQRHARDRNLVGEETEAALRSNTAWRDQTISATRARGDNAATRATPEALAQIMERVRGEESRIHEGHRQRRIELRKAKQTKLALLKATQRAERAELRLRHRAEVGDQAKRATELEGARGAAKAFRDGASKYADALRAYQEAVWEHPPANYRDAYMAIYERRLLQHTKVMGAVKKGFRSKLGMSEERVAELTKDPRVLAELSILYFKDVFDDPTMDAGLRADAYRAMNEAASSAKDEIRTLMAQGLDPPYVPVTHAWDESRVGRQIHPIVGHGIPTESSVKARLFDLTSDRHNFEVAADKALRETLRRDATIQMVTEHIKPIAVAGDDLRDLVAKLGFPGHRKTGALATSIEDAAHAWGLQKFDPEGLFGFTLPSWSGKGDLYLPESTVRGLKAMQRVEDSPFAAPIRKGTEVFRTAILGLSPRYTAHVLFGGTTMLALRASPYALGLIKKAHEMVRDGTLPSGIVHTRNTELGYQPNVLAEYNFRGAKQWAQLAKEEHVSVTQRIARGAAQPIHFIKATADLNYRFTTHIREMQSAVAYLDGAAKADRRGFYTDENGARVTMTRERAAYEGEKAVEKVFGNLRRMAPIERAAATSLMPFYGWTRHILGYVLSYPFDHPFRAMVLSQLAYHESSDVPKGLPLRLQFLFQLGSPDKSGNVTTVDLRFLDPFRDVANYASVSGWIQALNPAITGAISLVSPSLANYGDNTLYPNITYNDFYGIDVAGSQGNLGTAVSQFIPQVGALGSLMQAVGVARGEWQTNRAGAIKSIYESLGIPGQVSTINLKQLAARDEVARYDVAKAAGAAYLQTGDPTQLAGFSSVPNPLNPDYEISATELGSLYTAALHAYPSAPPAATLTPPPTPQGY